MQPLKILYIFSLVTVCYAGIAMAYNECDKEHGACNKEGKEWSPVSAGPVTTWTVPFCGRAKFVIQPFFFYNHTRGTFDPNDHYSSLPKGDYKYQFQEQFFAQYGLTDKLEIDAQTIYQENYINGGGVRAHSSGFGDSYLFMPTLYIVFLNKCASMALRRVMRIISIATLVWNISCQKVLISCLE